MPTFTNYIENKFDVEDFQNNNVFNTKVLFFNNDSNVPGEIKAITSYFRDRIDFGVIICKNDELLQLFNVTRCPSLAIFNKNEITRKLENIEYKGALRYKSLKIFLSGLASP